METHSLSQTERLIRRNGTWHYRRRVPKHLVETVGRGEIHHSLGTSNLKEARRLRTQLDLVWDSRFQTASGKEGTEAAVFPKMAAPFSTAEVLQLMQEYVAATSAHDADDALANPPADNIERAALREDIGIAETILRDRGDPRALEWVHATVCRLAPNRPPSAAAELEEIVRRGLIELERRKLQLLENLFDSTTAELTTNHSWPFENI